jgi:hypothetical protein
MEPSYCFDPSALPDQRRIVPKHNLGGVSSKLGKYGQSVSMGVSRSYNPAGVPDAPALDHPQWTDKTAAHNGFGGDDAP